MKKCVGTATAVAIAGLGLMTAAPAQAEVLLSLINPGLQIGLPFSLPFVAQTALTTVSIGGYDVPSTVQSVGNGVFLGGAGPNLLGPTWTLTPAAAGSFAFTYNDMTLVPALAFEGTVVGDYDTFSQTIPTSPGSLYTVNLGFVEDDYGPSGFRVTASPALPEPASMALLCVGLFGLGLIRCRRA